jgi:hypothetical protein
MRQNLAPGLDPRIIHHELPNSKTTKGIGKDSPTRLCLFGLVRIPLSTNHHSPPMSHEVAGKYAGGRKTVLYGKCCPGWLGDAQCARCEDPRPNHKRSQIPPPPLSPRGLLVVRHQQRFKRVSLHPHLSSSNSIITSSYTLQQRVQLKGWTRIDHPLHQTRVCSSRLTLFDLVCLDPARYLVF